VFGDTATGFGFVKPEGKFAALKLAALFEPQT
jgi:hypothetical protein